MNIACIVNTHGKPDCVLDTLDSITTYMTEQVIVLVDGVGWHEFDNVELPCGKVKGFPHGKPRAPFRNMALAMKTVTETYPDADWYCYTEFDCLFGSERFKENLKMADEMGVWMLGNDGHIDDVAMPLIQAMIEQPITQSYYMLGCCQFFNRKFIAKLLEINFFDRFLTMTNGFQDASFPYYSGWDISEHMYPTLCRHFGGNVGVWATFDAEGKWHGDYEHYPCRWKPELNPETENFPDASILHPIKGMDHPIRVSLREKRKIWKALHQTTKPSGS